MAKRNQYNRPDLDHITELTLNKLQVSGSIRASGSLFVQSGTDPEISLKKSNPGARMRYRILEETIDFSAGTNRGFSVNTGITAAARNGEVKYTGSVKIPVNSQVTAVGVYIGTAFSGSNYLKRVGITSSFGTPNATTATAMANKEAFYANANYFYGPNAPTAEANDASTRHFGAIGPLAGSSSMYFPSMGRVTGSTAANALVDTSRGNYFYTGFTGSNACLSFELNEASNQTGSITYAMFITQYGPPTSA